MNKFIEEIKSQFGLNNLDSKTMIFRYNGFISACNMNLDNSKWNEKGVDTNNPYINKERNIDGEEYSINFTCGYETGKGKVLILLGTYGDLSMFLLNYCDKDIFKFKINEIPFKMKLKKTIDNNDYLLEIECDNTNSLCIFKITKNNYSLNFDGTIKFDKILKIVESFTNNPEFVFDKYSEVINSKRFHFTDEELNSGLIDSNVVKKKKK